MTIRSGMLYCTLLRTVRRSMTMPLRSHRNGGNLVTVVIRDSFLLVNPIPYISKSPRVPSHDWDWFDPSSRRSAAVKGGSSLQSPSNITNIQSFHCEYCTVRTTCTTGSVLLFQQTKLQGRKSHCCDKQTALYLFWKWRHHYSPRHSPPSHDDCHYYSCQSSICVLGMWAGIIEPLWRQLRYSLSNELWSFQGWETALLRYDTILHLWVNPVFFLLSLTVRF